MTDRTKDLQGREYAKASTVKAGDVLECDGDFTCMKSGDYKTVKSFDGPMPHHDPEYLKDPFSRLYIDCTDEGGMHFLDGQCEDGVLIGLYPVIQRRRERQKGESPHGE